MRTIMLGCLFVTVIARADSQYIWTTPVPITADTVNCLHPAFANSWGGSMNHGEEMLAFSRNGKDIVVLRTTNWGGTWRDPPQQITADSADNDYPSLIHSFFGQPEDETAILVWQSRQRGNLDIFFSTYSHLAWSSPQPIDLNPEDDTRPCVSRLLGSYTATWERHGSILYSEFDGIIWSAPEIVSAPGDTLSHLPQVSLVVVPPGYPPQPLVMWDRKKDADTTHSIMYAFRNGGSWSTPDTLVNAGDNRRPRLFKYFDNTMMLWEKSVGSTIRCYSGLPTVSNGRCQFEFVSQLNQSPGDQRNIAVNACPSIITSNAMALDVYCAVAVWESGVSQPESIGVAVHGAHYYRLTAANGSEERNPDVSQGVAVGTGGGVRIWVVWEANVSGTWRLYASNTIVILGDVDQAGGTPGSFRLEQNYPNPFNPTTTIQFSLPPGVETLHATSLRVYDVLGREVATLVNEMKSPGRYNVIWDAAGVASAVYFYKLESSGRVETKRMILMK